MSTFHILIIAYVVLLTAYNLIAPKLYIAPYKGRKTPNSFSDNFNYMGGKDRLASYSFTAVMLALAFLALPVIMEMSAGEWFQPIGFLAVGMAAFVGASPCFRDEVKNPATGKKEKNTSMDVKAHPIFAISAAVLIVLFLCFAGYWYVVLGAAVIAGVIIWIGRGANFVNWLEQAAFYSLPVAAWLKLNAIC